MPTPLTRSALAAAVMLTCLLAPRVVRADETVRFETDGSEVYARTTQITTVAVPRGRYGTAMMRAPVYDPLCTEATCDRQMHPGEYHLGLAKPGGPVVEADEPVAINGGTTVRGTYTDNSGWRALGIVTVVVATAGGAAMIVASAHPCDASYGAASCPLSDEVNGPLFGGGLAVMGTGLIASLIMVLQRDSASFTVGPLALGALPGRRESGLGSATPSGLQLTMHF